MEDRSVASKQAAAGTTNIDSAREHLTTSQQFRRRRAAYSIPASPSEQKFTAFMISISGVGKSDRVVEIACGSGNTTLAFAQRCQGAVGVDVAEEPLRSARMAAAQRNLSNVDFIISELERLSFDDNSFNGALCRFSFYHFVNPARVFAELGRVVAPGGWMVIADMMASEDPARAEFQNQMERLCDPTHSRTLPASEFERMFAEHGFRIALKVEREAHLTLEDWIRFGGASENATRLREMAAAVLEQNGDGLRFTRDGEQIRLVHSSISFVIEND
jgi:ubiquinone/menaquinone biosynthesis C-methylase UbiE